jgi:plasmid maintenance system antidote protein VapI
MKLAEYLINHNLTHEAFANIVGVSRPIITDLANRKCNASVHMIRRIDKATHGDVSFNDLYLPESQSRLKRKPLGISI